MQIPDALARNIAHGIGKVAETVRRQPSGPPRATSWQAVTVQVDQDALGSPGHWPAPLAELGDSVEVRTKPAPADKGTELYVRARPATGQDDAELRRRIRAAVRRTKALCETGGVLTLDPHPAGERTATPAGATIDAADALADEEGIN